MGNRYNTSDLSGLKFNRLTVIRDSGLRDSNGGRKYVCICDCGKEKIVRQDSLKSGHVKSCGCYNLEESVRRITKHGQNKANNPTPEYGTWHAMIQRCNNPNNSQYKNYGGRGISVCERWMSFELFFEDMGKKPSELHSLDRFPDKNGNYELVNCRWATDSEQSRNKRTNRWLEYNGCRMIISDWATALNTTSTCISKMLKKRPFDSVVEFYTNKKLT